MSTGMSGMGGLGRFSRNIENLSEGFSLIADAFGVLADNPSLVAYPILGAITSFAIGGVGLAVVLTAWLTVGVAVSAGAGTILAILLMIPIALVAYLAIAFVNVVFVAAIVHEVYDYHHGIDTSLVSGLKAALSNWWPLLVWSAISWTIGRVLRGKRKNNDGVISKAIGEVVSTGWTAATFFIVPVVLFEDAQVRDMFQKSAGHFRGSWEQILAAVFGLRIIMWALTSVGGMFMAIPFLFGFEIIVWIIFLPITLFFTVLGTVIRFTLQGVIQGTVYEHLTAEDHSVEDVVQTTEPDADAGAAGAV